MKEIRGSVVALLAAALFCGCANSLFAFGDSYHSGCEGTMIYDGETGNVTCEGKWTEHIGGQLSRQAANMVMGAVGMARQAALMVVGVPTPPPPSSVDGATQVEHVVRTE